MRSELLERGEIVEGVVKLADAKKAAEVRLFESFPCRCGNTEENLLLICLFRFVYTLTGGDFED